MTSALNTRPDFFANQRGVATLELAVVLPVLLTMGLGALEFGNLIYQDHLVTNGVRDASRYLAGLPYDSANTTQITANKPQPRTSRSTATQAAPARRALPVGRPATYGYLFDDCQWSPQVAAPPDVIAAAMTSRW